MILPGCLSIVILPVVGALIGQWTGGVEAAMWGAGIGLGAGAVILAALLALVHHVKKQ